MKKELGRWERCKDCGLERDKQPKARPDVCNSCMELRLEVMKALKEKKISLDDFKRYQKALRGRSYKGADLARKLLGGIQWIETSRGSCWRG